MEFQSGRGLLATILFSFLITFSSAIDTITATQPIKDDGGALLSLGGKFAFGFFSVGGSADRYAGIWYNRIPDRAYVWVANRDHPVTDSSGVVTITEEGNLAVVDGRKRILWSTNMSTSAIDATATLLDSGDLVLSRKKAELWQSFDHPTDTHLPGMKLGLDRRRGLNRPLWSWRSPTDPGTGEFSYSLDTTGMPEFFLRRGAEPTWRCGPWNGQRMSGSPGMNQNSLFHNGYVATEDEIYLTYDLVNLSIVSHVVLDSSGTLQAMTYFDAARRWNAFTLGPSGPCDRYGKCGVNSLCDASRAPVCGCLPGYNPTSQRDWNLMDWTKGCHHRTPLECGGRDGFTVVRQAKVPDAARTLLNPNISATLCREKCLKDCSCTAYANWDVDGDGRGCATWEAGLMDLQVYSNGGQDIFVRVTIPDLSQSPKGFFAKRWRKVTSIVSIVLALLLLLSCGVYWFSKKRQRKGLEEIDCQREIFFGAFELEESGKNVELPFFNLSVIVAATQNFSEENKLGEGGFGPVYKGLLPNGQEIAVKRLSRKSGQGSDEFKNEVMLIAQLQHKNLVRVLGFCNQGEEKMLVYEYMPNKSLDSFIFDERSRADLDWGRRFEIIMGIARGVRYLHEDSRLKIIHRDLKASNILLDEKMNPKISDFGMARIFGVDQIQANTERVVGTYGYMSPEYAMDGLFSVKSDVFSFGVLLLEIISGRKNSSFCPDDSSLSLIDHAWHLWREGQVVELIDPSMADSCCEQEVLRCIHVGLLCVEENALDRPSMSTVVFMLANKASMPSPTHPAFTFRKYFDGVQPPRNGTGPCSINDVTISKVEAR